VIEIDFLSLLYFVIGDKVVLMREVLKSVYYNSAYWVLFYFAFYNFFFV